MKVKEDSQMVVELLKFKMGKKSEFGRKMSHLISGEKPNASHMCVRIKLHTYDRQNECNSIDSIKNVT
jgi:hypothetical protein